MLLSLLKCHYNLEVAYLATGERTTEGTAVKLSTEIKMKNKL